MDHRVGEREHVTAESGDQSSHDILARPPERPLIPLICPRLAPQLLSDHQISWPRSHVALNLLNFSIDWSLFLVLSCILLELRRFEDCSDNGLWPQWSSCALGSCVWCEL